MMLYKGNNGQNKDFYRLHKDPNPDEAEQIAGHLFLSSHPIILIPILKHWKHIDKLVQILTDPDFKDAMEGETVLIIDDEADQATVSLYVRYLYDKLEAIDAHVTISEIDGGYILKEGDEA